MRTRPGLQGSGGAEGRQLPRTRRPDLTASPSPLGASKKTQKLTDFGITPPPREKKSALNCKWHTFLVRQG